MRLAELAAGRLVVRRAGDAAVVGGRSIASRPERRITLPLPPADGPALTVALEQREARP